MIATSEPTLNMSAAISSAQVSDSLAFGGFKSFGAPFGIVEVSLSTVARSRQARSRCYMGKDCSETSQWMIAEHFAYVASLCFTRSGAELCRQCVEVEARSETCESPNSGPFRSCAKWSIIVSRIMQALGDDDTWQGWQRGEGGLKTLAPKGRHLARYRWSIVDQLGF